MSESEYHLDDKYTEGVWYDQMNGDFAEIQESADGELVELVNPKNGNVYWDMPVADWVEDEQSDFQKVPEEAVENPADYILEILGSVSLGRIWHGPSVLEEIGIAYAQQQVEISEK